MVSVHFTRPPTLRDLSVLKKKNVDEIKLPKSAIDRLSKRARSFLTLNNIKVSCVSSRGRPLGLDFRKVLDVVELHNDDRTYREIERILGVPKSTAHYLIKYAKRKKLKRDNKVVYLE